MTSLTRLFIQSPVLFWCLKKTKLLLFPAGKQGKFFAFDPLDGSSNIDCNVSVGTIFPVCTRRDQVSGSAEASFRSRLYLHG
jgi:fructose-1,6-bisphosphatase